MVATPIPRAMPVSGYGGRERRAWPRTTKEVRVLLLPDDSALEEPFGAWVIDSSRGGVRLRVPRHLFPVGTVLQIRTPFASGRVPWTNLRVRNLRRAEGGWEVGCEFVDHAATDTMRILSTSVTRVG